MTLHLAFKPFLKTALDRMAFVATILLLFAAPALALPVAKSPTPAFAPDDNSYQHLGQRFEDLLRDLDWGEGTVSILVQDAEVPVKVFGQNENAPMEPAGVIQIVTAAAALDRLGPDFRFTTTFGISGAVAKRELAGSVVIRGDGDPTLSARFLKDPSEEGYALFDRWAKLLRTQKIRKISGAIIGDDRAFDDQWHAPGWPLERLGDPDLPSVSALNFNHNCVDIFWQKTRKLGASAQCEIFPDAPQYVLLSNQVRIEADTLRGRQVLRERDSNVLQLNGSLLPKTEAHDRAAIEDPARFFAEAFKERLVTEHDIEVTGPADAANKLSPADIPKDVQALDTLQSPPLVQILSEMMHHDLALNAEVVFKTLGRKAGARQGSFASGQEAIRAFVDELHLPGSVWSFADGSGRSRIDRISPSQLLGLMRAMVRKGRGGDFGLLFPRAWEEGTLKDRFKPMKFVAPKEAPDAEGEEQKDKAKEAEKQAAREKDRKEQIQEEPEGLKNAPQIWAKSGASDGAEALAGYVQTRFGRRLAFAIMVNGSRLPHEVLRYQIDTLVLRLAE